VALYVADLTRRGRRPATIARKLAAIAVTTARPTTDANHDVVHAAVGGTRCQLGVAQPQKSALELDALRTVVLAIPDDLRGRRRSRAAARRLGGGAAPQRARRAGGQRPQF
jgi:hypothetical protein